MSGRRRRVRRTKCRRVWTTRSARCGGACRQACWLCSIEDGGAKGEQFPIWGRGQVDRLSTFDFNDKASRWAWYYVGGAIDPSEVLLGGELLPVGAVTGTVPTAGDTMQMFKSKNF